VISGSLPRIYQARYQSITFGVSVFTHQDSRLRFELILHSLTCFFLQPYPYVITLFLYIACWMCTS
jgi:hypothetical protein